MFIERTTLAKSMAKNIWMAIALSIVSGVLVALSMPNFNLWPLAWVAFVPLLVMLYEQPRKRLFILSLPFGIIWSVAVHNWYPAMFSPLLGYSLIVLVGAVYAWMIELGVWLQRKLPASIKILAVPVAWTALEWIRVVAPVTREWWFALLSYSQWNFPPALQTLNITGFSGLSFMIMLVNTGIALLIIHWRREKKLNISAVAAVSVVIVMVVGGVLTIPPVPNDRLTIGATTDLSLQDSAIQATEFSQNVFDINAELTREIVNDLYKREGNLVFVVWPENKFFVIDDNTITSQLKKLSDDLNIYIVVNGGWYTSEGMYNIALMVGPDGQEIGRQAKIHLAPGERDIFGKKVVPGPEEYPVFDTSYGKVGLAICYDIRFTCVVRNLARNGAQIMLVPINADFNHNRWFPIFFAVEAIFRAVENNLAIGTGTTSGISIVSDPYGRVSAMGGVNARGVITGEVFTVEGRTLYNRFGDWFGILVSMLLAVGIIFGSSRAGIYARSKVCCSV